MLKSIQRKEEKKMLYSAAWSWRSIQLQGAPDQSRSPNSKGQTPPKQEGRQIKLDILTGSRTTLGPAIVALLLAYTHARTPVGFASKFAPTYIPPLSFIYIHISSNQRTLLARTCFQQEPTGKMVIIVNVPSW